MKHPTCFDPCGIIISEYAYQMILYTTLTDLHVVHSSCPARRV